MWCVKISKKPLQKDGLGGHRSNLCIESPHVCVHACVCMCVCLCAKLCTDSMCVIRVCVYPSAGVAVLA